MVIQRDIIYETVLYDTTISNLLIIDDPYAHVIKYRSYYFFNIFCLDYKKYSWKYSCFWFTECGVSFHFLIFCGYLIMPLVYKGTLDYTTNVL